MRAAAAVRVDPSGVSLLSPTLNGRAVRQKLNSTEKHPARMYSYTGSV